MSAQNDRWAAISIYPLHGKGRWPTVIMYTEVTDVPKPAEGESGSKDHAHADVVPVERGIQNCGAAGVLCKVKSGGGMIQERRTADMPCKRKGEGGIAQDSRASTEWQKATKTMNIKAEFVATTSTNIFGALLPVRTRDSSIIQLLRSRQTVKPESSQDDVLLMNAFERIQTKGAQCHSDVKDQLHALQVAMDKATVDAVSSKSPFESKAKEKPSSVDFHACARLCSVLQGCYDRCVDTLKAESTETVRLFWDESSRWFAKEVIDCMNHAFDTELSCANSKGSSGDSSSCPQMEEQARRFIVAVTKVTESKQALSLSDAKKYKALHALVMAYLDGERGSLKQQEILQAMLFDNQELESFLKTIVPICWKLATIYMPPIFVCAQGGQTFNDCYHERHPKSHDSETTIKCCIFPLVLRDYRGQIRKKAVVLT